MKYALAWIIAMTLTACTARVLVRDCQDAGPGLKNCEKVKDL